MKNTYNIPSVTIGRVIDQLTELYASSYYSDVLSMIPSVALWGPMGVGKSTAVRTVANRLSKQIGVPVTVTDIRLLNFSPVDLRGIPSADRCACNCYGYQFFRCIYQTLCSAVISVCFTYLRFGSAVISVQLAYFGFCCPVISL